MPNKILKGYFTAEVDGDDIVFTGRATAFGVDDSGDGGTMANGFKLSANPKFLGVALPMRGYGIKSLTNSPLPKMPFGINSKGKDLPFGAHVIVEDIKTGKVSPTVPVIDLGPSGYTKNVVDLSLALARFFDPKATSNNFARQMKVRILGGKKWVVAA